MTQLIPAEGAGKAIIPPYNKVQTMIWYISQEVRGQSTHDSHRLKATVLKSVQAQKAYLLPGTIAVHKRFLLPVNKTDFYALWVYAVFRRSYHYLKLKNQGGFVAKQALRFDKMLTAF
jgi:hypothetical protein